MFKTALVVLLSACLILTGCFTTRLVPGTALQGGSTSAMKAGDTVHVSLKSGGMCKLRLVSVELDVLTGEDLESPGGAVVVRIAVADVQSVQVRRINWRRSIGVGVVVIAGALAAVIGAYLIKCGEGGRRCSD